MDLSVIIVSWNVKNKLRENLEALFSSSRPLRSPRLRYGEAGQGVSEASEVSFEVFVVDNDSADGTVEMVRQEFADVRVIANQANLGFAKANNQALRLCSGRAEFILLLNPDMRVEPDTLQKMIEWMRANPQASVAGCHLTNDQGETIKHVRRFPTVWDQLAIVLKLPHLIPRILDKYIIADFDYKKAAKVDSIRGGFFMLRRETLENIGLLDERYFLWFEEVDYCRRVKAAGGEVWYTPDAQCVDHVGQSFKQVKRGTAQGYFRDSMLKYFKKWHPAWEYYLLYFLWILGFALAALFDITGISGRTKT
jgi:hypothetical protein